MHELSEEQEHIIQHTLGLDQSTKPYRNHFCDTKIAPESKTSKDLAYLVSIGYMNVDRSTHLDKIYDVHYVTLKGVKAIKQKNNLKFRLNKELAYSE
jgi:hypothetical protein